MRLKGKSKMILRRCICVRAMSQQSNTAFVPDCVRSGCCKNFFSCACRGRHCSTNKLECVFGVGESSTAPLLHVASYHSEPYPAGPKITGSTRCTLLVLLHSPQICPNSSLRRASVLISLYRPLFGLELTRTYSLPHSHHLTKNHTPYSFLTVTT